MRMLGRASQRDEESLMVFLGEGKQGPSGLKYFLKGFVVIFSVPSHAAEVFTECIYNYFHWGGKKQITHLCSQIQPASLL